MKSAADAAWLARRDQRYAEYQAKNEAECAAHGHVYGPPGSPYTSQCMRCGFNPACSGGHTWRDRGLEVNNYRWCVVCGKMV